MARSATVLRKCQKCAAVEKFGNFVLRLPGKTSQVRTADVVPERHCTAHRVQKLFTHDLDNPLERWIHGLQPPPKLDVRYCNHFHRFRSDHRRSESNKTPRSLDPLRRQPLWRAAISTATHLLHSCLSFRLAGRADTKRFNWQPDVSQLMDNVNNR